MPSPFFEVSHCSQSQDFSKRPAAYENNDEPYVPSRQGAIPASAGYLSAAELRAASLLPLPDKIIAWRLRRSERTIQKQLASARTKTGASNRCELALIVRAWREQTKAA